MLTNSSALLKIFYCSFFESVIDFSRFSSRCLVLVESHSELNLEVLGLKHGITNSMEPMHAHGRIYKKNIAYGVYANLRLLCEVKKTCLNKILLDY